MENLLKEVEENINFTDMHDVNKVTADIVKEAAEHLKDGKTDPCLLVSSDCFRHAPDIFYNHLANIIKSFLVH